MGGPGAGPHLPRPELPQSEPPCTGHANWTVTSRGAADRPAPVGSGPHRHPAHPRRPQQPPKNHGASSQAEVSDEPRTAPAATVFGFHPRGRWLGAECPPGLGVVKTQPHVHTGPGSGLLPGTPKCTRPVRRFGRLRPDTPQSSNLQGGLRVGEKRNLNKGLVLGELSEHFLVAGGQGGNPTPPHPSTAATSGRWTGRAQSPRAGP